MKEFVPAWWAACLLLSGLSVLQVDASFDRWSYYTGGSSSTNQTSPTQSPLKCMPNPKLAFSPQRSGYDVGMEVQTSCLDGSRPENLTCQSTGYWTNRSKICPQCSLNPKLAFSPQRSNYSMFEKVQSSCYDGSSSENLTCQSTGYWTNRSQICPVQCQPPAKLSFLPRKTGYAVNATVQSTCHGGTVTETIQCLPTGNWTNRSNPCKSCSRIILGGSIVGEQINCYWGFTKVPATGHAVCNQDVGLYNQSCRQPALSRTYGVPTYVAVARRPIGYNMSHSYTYSRVNEVCAFYNMTAPTATCTSTRGCNNTCRQYRRRFQLGFTFPIAANVVKVCQTPNLGISPTPMIICESPGLPYGKCLPSPTLNLSPQKSIYDLNDIVQSTCPGGSLKETLTCLSTGHWSIRSNPCKACGRVLWGPIYVGPFGRITCQFGFTKTPNVGRPVCNPDLGVYQQFCKQRVVSSIPRVSDFAGVSYFVAVAYGPSPPSYSHVKNVCAYYGFSPPTSACKSSKGCIDTCQHYGARFNYGFDFAIADNQTSKCWNPKFPFFKKYYSYFPEHLIVCEEFECLPNPKLNFSPQRSTYAVGEKVQSSCYDGSLPENMTCQSTGYWTNRSQICPVQCRPPAKLSFSPRKTGYAVNAKVQSTCHGGNVTETIQCLPTGKWTNRSNPCKTCTTVFGGYITKGTIRCIKDFTKVPANGAAMCNQDVGLYNQICQQPALSGIYGVPTYVAAAFGPPSNKIPHTYSRVKEVCAFYNMSAPTATCASTKGCNNTCRQYGTLFSLGFNFPITENVVRVCQAPHLTNIPTPLIICEYSLQGKCLPSLTLTLSPQKSVYDLNDTVQSICPGGSHQDTLTCLSTGQWSNRSNPCQPCTQWRIMWGYIHSADKRFPYSYISCTKGWYEIFHKAVCNQDLGLYQQFCKRRVVNSIPRVTDFAGVSYFVGVTYDSSTISYSRVKKVCAAYGLSVPTSACMSSKGCNDTCQQYGSVYFSSVGFDFVIAGNQVRKCPPLIGKSYNPYHVIVCEEFECLPNPMLAFSPQRSAYAVGMNVQSSCPDGSRPENLTCQSTGYWTNRSQICPECLPNPKLAFSPQRSAYAVGMNVQSSCHDGSRTENSTCQSTGYWTKRWQICPVHCLPTTKLNFSPPKMGYAVNATVQSTCLDGSAPETLICLSTGQWTNRTNTCQGKPSFFSFFSFAKPPPAECKPNPEFNFSPNKSSFAVGEKVQSSCADGSRTENVTCESTGLWTNRSQICSTTTQAPADMTTAQNQPTHNQPTHNQPSNAHPPLSHPCSKNPCPAGLECVRIPKSFRCVCGDNSPIWNGTHCTELYIIDPTPKSFLAARRYCFGQNANLIRSADLSHPVVKNMVREQELGPYYDMPTEQEDECGLITSSYPSIGDCKTARPTICTRNLSHVSRYCQTGQRYFLAVASPKGVNQQQASEICKWTFRGSLVPFLHIHKQTDCITEVVKATFGGDGLNPFIMWSSSYSRMHAQAWTVDGGGTVVSPLLVKASLPRSNITLCQVGSYN